MSPADQSTGVARNASVTIDFDRSIETGSAGRISLTAAGTPVAVIAGFANGDARVVLTPVVPLQPSTVYLLTIGAVTDVSRQPLATPVVTRFTTGSGVDLNPPVVTAESPAYGAANVPTNTLIQIGFNEAINPDHRERVNVAGLSGGNGYPGRRLVSGGRRWPKRHVRSEPCRSSPSTVYVSYVSGILDFAGQGAYSYTTFTTGLGVQTTGPTVVALSPPDGSIDAPLNTHVVAQLSSPINPLTVRPTSIALTADGSPVAATTTLSADRLILTLTPLAPLAATTVYTVMVGGVADVAGNLMTPATAQFTTGTAAAGGNSLSVTAIAPSDGSVDVPVDTTVEVTFTSAVDPSSVAVGTVTLYVPGVGNLAASYAVNGDRITVTPSSALPGNTTIYLQVSGVRDLAGNAVNYSNTWFRTAAAADTTPPTVISVTPGNGMTGVGLNASVVITFSESVNPATVNNNAFALFANGSRFGGVSSISVDNRTVVLNGGTLPGSSVITVAVTSAVRDLSDNPLADFSTTFTTASGFDTSRPSIVGQRPGNGASGVMAATGIVLFVNEPLLPSTIDGALHVSQNGVVVGGTVHVSGTGQTLHFQPDAPWTPNALIQVFLDASATDANGNRVHAYQGSFRTASDSQTDRPAGDGHQPRLRRDRAHQRRRVRGLQRAAGAGLGQRDNGPPVWSGRDCECRRDPRRHGPCDSPRAAGPADRELVLLPRDVHRDSERHRRAATGRQLVVLLHRVADGRDGADRAIGDAAARCGQRRRQRRHHRAVQRTDRSADDQRDDHGRERVAGGGRLLRGSRQSEPRRLPHTHHAAA